MLVRPGDWSTLVRRGDWSALVELNKDTSSFSVDFTRKNNQNQYCQAEALPVDSYKSHDFGQQIIWVVYLLFAIQNHSHEN